MSAATAAPVGDTIRLGGLGCEAREPPWKAPHGVVERVCAWGSLRLLAGMPRGLQESRGGRLLARWSLAQSNPPTLCSWSRKQGAGKETTLIS